MGYHFCSTGNPVTGGRLPIRTLPRLYLLGIVPNANPNSAAGETAATIGLGRQIDALFSVETRLLVSF